MRKSKNILFVFEGQKSEPLAFTSLQRFFLNEDGRTIIHAVFCGEIYSLYHTLKKDEDLELFYILKGKELNKDSLADLSLKDISEVYLFFDHDAHATAADEVKLREMLEFFNEETENGKLYISYPMVEAIKHFHPDHCFKSLTVEIGKNKQYKAFVANNCCNQYKNIQAYSKEQWFTLIKNNLMKASYIVSGNYELPEHLIPQPQIFSCQQERYIKPRGEVSVLSSIPLFLKEYYGVEKLLDYLP